MKLSKPNSAGFTLIELLLALSIFSIIMLLAYQSLTQIVDAKRKVVQSTEVQSQTRITHRTFSNAVNSAASFVGDTQTLTLDLDSASSNWLAGSARLDISLDKQRNLMANIDQSLEPSLLISDLEVFELGYFDGAEIRREWRSNSLPKALIVSWQKNSELVQWWFTVP